ncbi:MAG TPA: fused MFS/spermidine synthase [Candidatus Saccharimonadales bacterium]|jgi:spermidine synthase
MNTLNFLRSYKYEFVAFLTGASVMVLEIVGARLIAPTFGTSLYVWTAIIGVILGLLALGYWAGGLLADKRPDNTLVGSILFAAALTVLLISFTQEPLLNAIASFNLDLRLSAVIAALLLFGVPSFLIGMVSPHLAKIQVKSLEQTGRSIGRLEAAGALGSIIGTFSCGYFLLGLFGSRQIVIGVAGLLLLTSFIIDRHAWKGIRLFVVGILLLGGIGIINTSNPSNLLADVDSSYTRYQVFGTLYNAVPVNILTTDRGGIQSAVPTNGSKELVLSYVQHFYEAAERYGKPGKVLVVGGGTYTFPSALVDSFPTTAVDVVEIDPKLDELARKHFEFKDNPRLTIHHQDGRTFINKNTGTYDLIYMDAFSSLSPPFQLTTLEATERLKQNLSSDGVIVVNLIGNYLNNNDPYLRAVQTTYEQTFDNVALYLADPAARLSDGRQNFILYATNSDKTFAKITPDTAVSKVPFQQTGQLLTDNFAPIEQLTY